MVIGELAVPIERNETCRRMSLPGTKALPRHGAKERSMVVSTVQAQGVVCSSVRLPRECLSQAGSLCSLL